jgi:hypothetical protein
MRLMAQFRQFAARVPQSQAQVRGLIFMAGHFSAVPGWGAPSFDDPHSNFPAMPLFIDPEVTVVPFTTKQVTGRIRIPHFDD